MATPSQSDPRTSSSPSHPRGPGTTPPVTGGPGSTVPAPGSAGASARDDGATYGSAGGTPGTSSTGTHPHGTAGTGNTAETVKEHAGAYWDDAKEAARSKLNEQKDLAAGGINQVAGALREAAQRQPGDGAGQPLAQLTNSAAEGLEQLSNTLRNKDVATMLRDMDNFARNQPVAFFGMALAAGFLAVRFLKAGNH